MSHLIFIDSDVLILPVLLKNWKIYCYQEVRWSRVGVSPSSSDRASTTSEERKTRYSVQRGLLQQYSTGLRCGRWGLIVQHVADHAGRALIMSRAYRPQASIMIWSDLDYEPAATDSSYIATHSLSNLRLYIAFQEPLQCMNLYNWCTLIHRVKQR